MFILNEFLSGMYITKIDNVESVLVEVDGKKLELPDTFFFGERSIPELPLSSWDAIELI